MSSVFATNSVKTWEIYSLLLLVYPEHLSVKVFGIQNQFF